MKKFLLNSRLLKVSLVVAGLLFTATIFAQTTINDGQTISASNIAANTAIIINAGGTLDMDVSKAFSSLTTANAGTSTISGIGSLTLTTAITVAGANTLSVAPPIIAPNLATANLTNQIATVTGSGIITVDGITINGTNGNSATFVVGSGLTVQTISIAGAGGNGNNSAYNLIVDGILRISGAIDASGPGSLISLTSNTGSTVEYNGGAAQSIFATNYHHLILSGSGVKALENAGGATPLVFAGNVEIAAGATFDNNNKILSVAGNWQNDGVFTQGPGDVIFSGNSVQSIGGTQPTTFREIIFANTNGGVTLTKPVTVTLNATFTSGIVTSDATNLLIFNDGATSSLTPAMATTSSYVSGPVRKVGNDPFVFPIGAATGFVPLTISAPNDATDAYTAQYFRGAPVDNANITAAGIDHISGCDYWNLALTEGGTAATISATFYWNANNPCGGTEYVTDPTMVKAVQYTGGSWSAASIGVGTGSDNAGSVIFTGLTPSGPFALGSTSSAANPLPVVFADVKAYEKDNGVQIEWSNLTEKDVAEYTIERSVNGRDFSAIGKQLPTSNQNDKASYDAFDAAPNTGANYYRIKAEETTGKIVYSKILSVNLGKANRGLKLYPNPVSGNQVTISLSNVKKGQYNLRVVNTAGQDIFKQTINNHSSSLTQTIDLPASVKPGVYNMIVTGNDYRESKMFIAQ